MYGFKLPKGFLIGTANSAFQSEGAWDRDGKSESIMDHFAKEYAGKYAPAIERKIKAGRIKSGRVEKNSEELPDRGCFFYDNYEAYIEDIRLYGAQTPRLRFKGYDDLHRTQAVTAKGLYWNEEPILSTDRIQWHVEAHADGICLL